MGDLDSLREEWKTLYCQTLPSLARAKDAAQAEWPVALDHCFARIILDNTVGKGVEQWDKVIPKPAVRHMTAEQLTNAIELGEKIKSGEMNLCELDQISLLCRGKNESKYGTKQIESTVKRKRETTDDSQGSNVAKAKVPKRQTTLSFSAEGADDAATSPSIPKCPPEDSKVDFAATLERIQQHSTLTPYRKRLYTILLSVPRGRYTTYMAMSDYLNSSARAVGNGMRNNPFAPDVPCHRCLAADGSIGGFNGHWGREGKYASDKLKLLREEGVRFDGNGKVVGEPFRQFHEFQQQKEDGSTS